MTNFMCIFILYGLSRKNLLEFLKKSILEINMVRLRLVDTLSVMI